MKTLTIGSEVKIKVNIGNVVVTEKVTIIEFGWNGEFLAKVKNRKNEELWVRGNVLTESEDYELKYSTGNTASYQTKFEVKE